MKITPVFFGDRLIFVVLVDATNFWSYEDLKIIMCVFMYECVCLHMCVCMHVRTYCVCIYVCT